MSTRIRSFASFFTSIGAVFLFMAALLGNQPISGRLVAAGVVVLAWTGVVSAIHWKFPEDFSQKPR